MSKQRVGHISRQDATIACGVCAILGAALTALVLIGSDIPLKCFEGGNVADWGAAVGTAVVGVGAIWFAHEAHRLRLKEVAKDEENDLNLEAGRILATSYRLEIAKHPGKAFAAMEISNERVNSRLVEASLTTSLSTLSGLTWKEDEIAVLPRACIPLMVALQISLRAYLDFGQRLLTKCQSNVTLSVKGAEYMATASAADQLRSESAQVIQVLLARLDEIRERLIELRAER